MPEALFFIIVKAATIACQQSTIDQKSWVRVENAAETSIEEV
ncbi:hypothetical protein [Rhizorhapis sp. SPR117]